MTHVAEECSLGAVKIGQFFGAPSFRFVGLSVRDAGGNLAGGQIEKACIACVKLAVGVERCDEDTGRLLLAALEHGDQSRQIWRLVPNADGQVGKEVFKPVDRHGSVGAEENVDGPWTAQGFGVDFERCGGVSGFNAGLGSQAESRAALFEAVDQREGDILLARQAALYRVDTHLFSCSRSRARRQVC